MLFDIFLFNMFLFYLIPFYSILFHVCPVGGVQETETVLCDVWRVRLIVPALRPRTTMRELLHLPRVPTLLRTVSGPAALLTPQHGQTTADHSHSVLIPQIPASNLSHHQPQLHWCSFKVWTRVVRRSGFCTLLRRPFLIHDWLLSSGHKIKALHMGFRIFNGSSITYLEH